MVKEPTRRADALRMLTDFSLNEVYPLLFDLVKKSLKDPNPYVRRAAIFGLSKLLKNTELKLDD